MRSYHRPRRPADVPRRQRLLLGARALDELPRVLELRRGRGRHRYRDEAPGEYYLGYNGRATAACGGAWGRAPGHVGVGSRRSGFDGSGAYRRTPDSFDPRAAFVFEGIGEDEVIGDFGILGGGAGGSEIDAVRPRLGTPPHTLVVATAPKQHSANTTRCPTRPASDHAPGRRTKTPRARGHAFFETPSGGAVFSVGSIAWRGSLAAHNGYDNNVARVSGNVVRRFLEEQPFRIP